jgi:hypothetical protein
MFRRGTVYSFCKKKFSRKEEAGYIANLQDKAE